MTEKQKVSPTLAGRGNTHRKATAEELKVHEQDRPKILKAIQQNHAKTMHKVRRMQSHPIYVDKGL